MTATDPEGNDPLTLAHRYATAGLRVLPIPPGRKHPPMTAWQDAATTDPATLDAWWTGLYAGHGCGLAPDQLPDGRWWFAVDIDQHGIDGAATWQDLCDGHDGAPATVEATTGGGGTHLIYAAPTEIRNAKLADGIDIRGHGGQIVAEPSIHPSGQPYTWVDGQAPWEHPIADAPGWLLTMLSEPAPVASPTTLDRGPIGDRPGDLWAAATSWADLLAPDGWTLHHTDPTGEQHWTRPGKDTRHGTSATVGHKGSDVLKVFTSSHPTLDAEATYTKLGYLASTRFDGDHAAAAGSLAQMGYRSETPTPGAIVLAGPGTMAAAMAAAEAPPSEPWPEPVGLTIAGPTPDVPIDALPRWLADQVRNVSTQLMCDPMLPFTFGLGALSVASLGHIRVAVRAGQIERSTGLYVAAAGPPASGKSPALAFMIRPVRAFEAEAIHQASTELARSAARRKMAAKEAENASDLAARTGDPDDKRKAEELAAAAADEKDPPSGELMTSDITPERLASLMAANAERAAIVSDESGVLEIDRYGDKGAAKKLDIYLQSFTGEAVVVHRVKAPTVRLTTPLLAIVAGVQPEALAAAMGDHEWRTRGMGSRFLTASTTELAANTDIDLDLWDYDVGDAYDAEMGGLARQWASWATPATLSLGYDARRTFSTWAASLRDREMTGDLEGEGGWASKMRTSVLRIAALLHLADGQPHDADVAAETMTRAIGIGEFFIAHHTAEADESNTGSVKLLTCLLRLAGEDEGKTAQSGARRGLFAARSKLSKHGPRGMRRIEAYTPALVALIEAGLVRLVGVTGGPNMLVTEAIKRAPLIEVHPDAAQHVDRAALRGAARHWPVDGDETSRGAQDTAHTAHTAYRVFQTPPFLGVCAPDETDPRGVRGLAPESESRGVSVSAVDDAEEAIGDDEDGLF